MSSDTSSVVKLRLPNSLILKIYGCISSYKVQYEELDLYLRKNLTRYLKDNWQEKKIKIVRTRLFRETQLDLDSGVCDIPSIPGEDEKDDEIVFNALVKNILWRLDRPLSKGSIITHLQDWIWSSGYLNGQLKSHLYPDSAECLTTWKYKHMIKLYSCENADPSGQRYSQYKSVTFTFQFNLLDCFFNQLYKVTLPNVSTTTL